MNEEKDNNETVANIIQDTNGKFNGSLSVTGYFNSKSRRQIESKTKTTIKMPYKKPEGNVQVIGSTRSSVEEAMNEIECVLATQKQRLTHFISIPVNDTGISEKFLQFKNEVGAMDDTNILDEYFQKTYKLHLTLGVLSLFNDEQKNAAIKALQESRAIVDRAKTRFKNPGDLRIKVLGVNCMNSTPPKCRILYGVVESEILQTIANEIVGHFISKGLIEKDKSQVKLHITMMNVVFAKRITGNRCKNFDASSIVDKYSNYEFGDQTIDEIHLSRFERTGECTYYQPEEILKLFDGTTKFS